MVRSQRFYYILFHFPRITRVWVEAQTTLSPATSSSPSVGTHRWSRGLMGSVVPPACQPFASGSRHIWTWVVHLHRETSRRRLDQMAERRAAAALGCLSSLPAQPPSRENSFQLLAFTILPATLTLTHFREPRHFITLNINFWKFKSFHGKVFFFFTFQLKPKCGNNPCSPHVTSWQWEPFLDSTGIHERRLPTKASPLIARRHSWC